MQDKIMLQSIQAIAEQYDVSQAKIADLLMDTIVRTYNKQRPDQKINVNIDVDKGFINADIEYTVIDNVPEGEYDDFIELPLNEAQKYGTFKIGDICHVPLNIFNYFKKQEIMTILQVFKQRLNEINNIKTFEKWSPHIGEIIYCMVEKHDATKGFYVIDLNDGNMGFLSKNESIPTETLVPGQKYKFYVKDVKEQSKGWPIILSRADSHFASKLLELEVPELESGEIVVNKIERIAGFKTKLIVSASGAVNYDPCAVVVGPKGSRVKAVSDQLNGEKIEVIRYSEDPKQQLINACSAKNLVGIKYIPATEQEQAYATLVVNEDVLPLIIGKKGFNIKLISKLLNCNIDISTVAEARERGLDFEPVKQDQMTHNNFRSNNGHQRPNYQNYMVKGGGRAAHNSSDMVLDDIENLSQEELEARYHVKLKVNPDNARQAGRDHQFEMDSNQQDYENSDLADAFADEIADILKTNDK